MNWTTTSSAHHNEPAIIRSPRTNHLTLLGTPKGLSELNSSTSLSLSMTSDRKDYTQSRISGTSDALYNLPIGESCADLRQPQNIFSQGAQSLSQDQEKRPSGHKKTWSNVEESRQLRFLEGRKAHKELETSKTENIVLVDERLAQASDKTRYRHMPTCIEYQYSQEGVLEPFRIADYQIIKTIGSGSTGKVKLAMHSITSERVAIKIVPRLLTTRNQKSKESVVSRERRILREAALLNLIHHPNIVRLLDLLVTDDYFCLIFEYVDGKELLDVIVEKHQLSERRARLYFCQLLNAVEYCHEYGIVHRDLKIENILVPSQDTEKVVLCDFGLANLHHPRGPRLSTYCGSLYFAAPELLHGRPYSGPEVDIWSLGIVLYVMLVGRVPFDDKSLSILHGKIKKGIFEIPAHVSSAARDLLQRIIQVTPSQRSTIEQIKKHPWLKDTQSTTTTVPHSTTLTRNPFEHLDERIVKLLIDDFASIRQYDTIFVQETLQRAFKEWSGVYDHPICKLYLLALKRYSDSKEIDSMFIPRPHSVSDQLLFKDLEVTRQDIPNRPRSKSFVDRKLLMTLFGRFGNSGDTKDSKGISNKKTKQSVTTTKANTSSTRPSNRCSIQ